MTPDPRIMEADLRELRRIVDEQAEAWELWFVAEHVTEANLQYALRRLHEAIERATRWMPEATTNSENG